MDHQGSSMDNNNHNEEDDCHVELPPGFRFHPTDEEIIMHYLLNKVIDRRFSSRAIGEADLNKCEPWDLPKKAKMGEKEWFFFFQRDRKYPTGMRTNRATESGYWKATGKDKEIYKTSCLVGMKKTLVFYKGRAPKGVKTNWVMHEFRLEGNFSDYNFSRAAKEDWVVSKITHKSSTGVTRGPAVVDLARIDSFADHLLLHDNSSMLPHLTDVQQFKPNNITPSNYMQMQNDQKPIFVNPQNFTFNATRTFSSQFAPPGSIFPHQESASLGYNHDYQVGLSYPFKGAENQADLRLMAPNMPTKMEPFSTSNSMVSHSQDTGLSTDHMALANEITSVQSKGDIESKKLFDQQFEGISFSPEISDLDSFWGY